MASHVHPGSLCVDEDGYQGSWSVNTYCTWTSSCVDKPDHSHNADGSRDSPTAFVVCMRKHNCGRSW